MEWWTKKSRIRVCMVTLLFFLIFLLKKIPRLRTLSVTVPFNLTVKVLLFIGKVFHLSYNAVNIIIWYIIFPMFWMSILDYKFHRILFVTIWLLLCLGLGYVQRKKFNRFCNLLFKLPQEFILSFGNYYLWSVIICLLIPLLITIVLLIA